MRKGIVLSIMTLTFVLILTPAGQAQYFKFDNAASNQQIDDEVKAILKFFGTIVGGGLFHTADLHSVAGADIGLKGVLANVPEDFKSLPVFADEDFVGLAFLHGSLGLPGNFELLGRFFYFPLGADADENISPPRSDSRGGVTLIGAGLKYGLIQAPGLPKVAIIGAYHALFVPQEFDFGTVGTLSIKGVASYSVPLLTLYVGAGVDISSLKLNDPFLDGKRFTENQTHFTVGAKVTVFPLVHVSGSYNVSEFSSVDLGIGISFR
ncbi:MAG: DUF6588 family protein [bacterium]